MAISLATANDADGRPIGRIGVVRDITLELERARCETQERLAASEARFRTAMDSMLDGLIVYSAVRDEHGRVVDLLTEYANRAVVRHEGLPPEQQVGRTMHELYPNRDEDGVFDRYVQVVEAGEPARLQVGAPTRRSTVSTTSGSRPSATGAWERSARSRNGAASRRRPVSTISRWLASSGSRASVGSRPASPTTSTTCSA